MKHLLILLALVGIVGTVRAQTSADTATAYVGGTVIRTDGTPHLQNAVVLVQNGRILQVGGPKTKLPRGVRVVDAKGKFLLPGLVDAHIHFFQSGGLYTRPDGLDFNRVKPYAKELTDIKASIPDLLRRYLACGVVGVADVGGPMWNFNVRQMAEAAALAPAVAVTGPLISTVSREQLDLGDPPIVKCSTPAEAEALVAKQLAFKPDYIKVWYIADANDTNVARNNFSIVKAAADAAKRAGLRLAVHATELHTAKLALQAGASILVHSVEDKPVDDEFLALAKRNNVLYIPTLIVGEGYLRSFTHQHTFTQADYRLADQHVLSTLMDVRHIPDTLLPPGLRGFSNRRANPNDSVRSFPMPGQAIEFGNLRKVQAAGIRVAMGTDAGNVGTLHGSSVYTELARMVAAGLTPTQALHAATANGAAVLGKSDLGAIAVDKRADFLLLDADPTLDIANVQRIHRVVYKGNAYTQTELLPTDSPEIVVQRQLNTYNAHDIDAFLATYAPDAKLYNHPDSLTVDGQAKMRAIYGPLFERNPRLHCELQNRTVNGSYVIDQERFWNGYRSFSAVAIYQVQDGLIRKVWFLPFN